METESRTAAAPIVKDIRAYTQGVNTVLDERSCDEVRRTSFLTAAEERWYRRKYRRLAKEFGLI